MSDVPYVRLGEQPFARWSEERMDIPPHLLDWLTRRIGRLTPTPPEVVPARVEVPKSRLGRKPRKELEEIAGREQVDDSREARLRRSGGQSYPDLVRRRAGLHLDFPDAVVRPEDHDQVRRILDVCSSHGIAVVPYGGGTSVVRGVDPVRGDHDTVITLDLARMDRRLDLDTTSRTATFQAGITGPDAERSLQADGLTLGHFPQSFARASLGGYVATRSAGQASTGYGRIHDLLVRLHVATPAGDLELGTGTPNAAGPDLRALFVGSEGTLGVLTEVTMRVRPAPTDRSYRMIVFDSFAQGLEAVRALAQSGRTPDVLRLSDEDETAMMRAVSGPKGTLAGLYARTRGVRAPAFCVLGVEQPGHRLDIPKAAVSLGKGAGEAWRIQRYAGPVQRDSLLDAGMLVETLETATTWSNLTTLYDAVRSALRSSLEQPLVLAHVSHVYATGASLYFTILARAEVEPQARLDQWARAKQATSEAIQRAGGTITHHHAVGRDHARYLETEIGSPGLEILRGVKRTLDPNGILNPGVLLG